MADSLIAIRDNVDENLKVNLKNDQQQNELVKQIELIKASSLKYADLKQQFTGTFASLSAAKIDLPSDLKDEEKLLLLADSLIAIRDNVDKDLKVNLKNNQQQNELVQQIVLIKELLESYSLDNAALREQIEGVLEFVTFNNPLRQLKTLESQNDNFQLLFGLLHIISNKFNTNLDDLKRQVINRHQRELNERSRQKKDLEKYSSVTTIVSELLEDNYFVSIGRFLKLMDDFEKELAQLEGEVKDSKITQFLQLATSRYYKCKAEYEIDAWKEQLRYIDYSKGVIVKSSSIYNYMNDNSQKERFTKKTLEQGFYLKILKHYGSASFILIEYVIALVKFNIPIEKISFAMKTKDNLKDLFTGNLNLSLKEVGLFESTIRNGNIEVIDYISEFPLEDINDRSVVDINLYAINYPNFGENRSKVIAFESKK